MARDQKRLPQPSDEPVQDFRLIQALDAGREQARRQEGEGWDDLARSIDDLLNRMGADTGAPEATPAVGIRRIDRRAFAPDPAVATAVVSSLMALADRPDAHHVQLAQQAVADLGDAIG